jgi:uncharacterized membrane protein YkvA (DUF1232 family)
MSKWREVDTKKYEQHYSEEEFWNKIARFATKAGRKCIKTALAMYFALQDTDTPAWAKGIILGALGYFILPVDLIPDVLPVVGFTDDIGIMAAALAVVGLHVKPIHKKMADEKIGLWFN